VLKAAELNCREVNCTEPSPSVRVSWCQCYKTFLADNFRIFVIR
jgi:hypothetical protein